MKLRAFIVKGSLQSYVYLCCGAHVGHQLKHSPEHTQTHTHRQTHTHLRSSGFGLYHKSQAELKEKQRSEVRVHRDGGHFKMDVGGVSLPPLQLLMHSSSLPYRL